MKEVMEEMRAKEEGSWGKEMAEIDRKAKLIQQEMPKLYIGKVFKSKIEKKGERVPNFLKEVETSIPRKINSNNNNKNGNTPTGSVVGNDKHNNGEIGTGLTLGEVDAEEISKEEEVSQAETTQTVKN